MALLAGCGSARPHSVGYLSFKGLLPGAVSGSPFDVAIEASGAVMAVTVYGSGSCPGVPVAVHVFGPHLITVRMSADYRGGCTDDLGPTTTLVNLATAVTVDDALRVQYSGLGRGEVRPRQLTSMPTTATPLGTGS